MNHDKVWIVNGLIEKLDANFVSSLDFDKIGDYGIFIGPYPQIEKDIKKMKKAGVTSVLNV